MPTNIRVLILEDRAEDAELMVHELRRNQFDPEWRRVDTESEYKAHLGWEPDITFDRLIRMMVDEDLEQLKRVKS